MKKLFSLILLTLSLPVVGMHPSIGFPLRSTSFVGLAAGQADETKAAAGQSAPAATPYLEVKTNDEEMVRLSQAEIASLGKNNFLAIHTRTPGFQDSVPNLEYVSTNALKNLLHIGTLSDDETKTYLQTLDDQAIFEIFVACDFLMCFQDEQKQSIIATPALYRLIARLGNEQNQEERNDTTWLLGLTEHTPSISNSYPNVLEREYALQIIAHDWIKKWLPDDDTLGSAIAWRPNGQIFATGSNSDGSVMFWSKDGALMAKSFGAHGFVAPVLWSPDGQMLATGSYVDDGTVRLWRADGSFITIITREYDGSGGLAWSPDSQTLAVSTLDDNVELRRIDGTLVTTLAGHTYGVTSISWNPNGQTLATNSYDKTVRLWRADGTLIATLVGHTARVTSISWSPDGQTLATGSDDHTVKLWRTDGTLIATLADDAGTSPCVAWSPNGQLLATSSNDHTVKLWHTDRTLFATLDGHTSYINSIAWRPDSKMLATSSSDCTVKLWHADGTLFTSLRKPCKPDCGNAVVCVLWSHDSQILVTGFDSGKIKLRSHTLTNIQLTTMQKLLLIKFAQQKTLTPAELDSLQKSVDTLPEPAQLFIAQCVKEQS